MKFTKWMAAAAFAVGVAELARAQAPAPVADMLAVRQASMDLLYGTWRGLRVGVEAKVEPKNFINGAKGIVAFARQLPALFPPGGSTGRIGLPAMNEDRAGFEQAMAGLLTAGEALLKVTQANDVEGFGPAVKALTETCGNCHPRKYSGDWNK